MARKVKLKIKVYTVVREAVERGVKYGVNRAFKHSDDPPREYMCEVVNFDD